MFWFLKSAGLGRRLNLFLFIPGAPGFCGSNPPRQKVTSPRMVVVYCVNSRLAWLMTPSCPSCPLDEPADTPLRLLSGVQRTQNRKPTSKPRAVYLAPALTFFQLSLSSSPKHRSDRKQFIQQLQLQLQLQQHQRHFLARSQHHDNGRSRRFLVCWLESHSALYWPIRVDTLTKHSPGRPCRDPVRNRPDHHWSFRYVKSIARSFLPDPMLTAFSSMYQIHRRLVFHFLSHLLLLSYCSSPRQCTPLRNAPYQHLIPLVHPKKLTCSALEPPSAGPAG